MPLTPEQEALCERLENVESMSTAAALIRQQAHEIDDLWDRLSRAYALVRRRVPSTNDPRRDGATRRYAGRAPRFTIQEDGLKRLKSTHALGRQACLTERRTGENALPV
jgi:hypothetical protein